MWKSALVLIVLLLQAPSGLANDFAYGGEGSNLMPLQKTPIRMVSETITIESASLQFELAEGWQVRAVYVFENPTDAPQTVKMGFPEFRCTEGEGDCVTEGPTFVELKTWVGGVEVEMGEGKISKRHKWSADLDRVHTFEVPFAPRQIQKVLHTYRFAGSSSVWAEHPSYVTRTGALWSGPIGRARFIIRTPVRPYGLSYPSEFELVGYAERLEGKRYVTEIVFEQENWVPRGDLELELHHRSTPLLDKLNCPMMEVVIEDADLLLSSAGAHLWKELRALSTEELRRCRNLPYAAHGYPFEDRVLREIFYAFDKEKDRTNLFSRVNRDFTPAMLSGGEWLYIRVMKRVEEERRKACQATPCAPAL